MNSYFVCGHVLFTMTACAAIMRWQWGHALRIVGQSRERQQCERQAPAGRDGREDHAAD